MRRAPASIPVGGMMRSHRARLPFIDMRRIARPGTASALSSDEAAVLHVLTNVIAGQVHLADMAMVKLLIEHGQVDMDRITPLVWAHWVQAHRSVADDV